MTDDEVLFDRDDNRDNIMENEDDNSLNSAYDRVSGSGEMPSLEDFLGNDFSDPTNETSAYSDGIGDEFGELRISDEVIEPDDNAGGNLGDDDDAEPDKFSPISILNGKFFKSKGFIRNIPFVLVLGVIGLLYIANRNFSESQIARCIRLQKEVRDLRAESITIAGQLMDISKETEVAKRVEVRRIGIHEQNTPPLYFIIDKYVAPDSLRKKDAAPKRDYINDFNDFEDDFKEMN